MASPSLHSSLSPATNPSTPRSSASPSPAFFEPHFSLPADPRQLAFASLSIDCSRRERGSNVGEGQNSSLSLRSSGRSSDTKRRNVARIEESFVSGSWRINQVRSEGRSDSEAAGRLGSHYELVPKVLRGAESLSETSISKDEVVGSTELDLDLDMGAGGGNVGGDSNGNNGGDGGGGEDDDADGNHHEEEEFGPLLNAEEVNKQVNARGIVLPADMAQAARTTGVRSLLLARYIDLQGAGWPLGAAIQGSSVLRNRMLADQAFLFKVLTEIAIDSGCATFAEVQKRGKDFWNEFELYMADLLVGVVVDVALVGMLAPYVRFGRTVSATGRMARISQAIHSLPSSVFEAATPGRRFSVQQRAGTYFYKAIEYGAIGFFCGIIGQGIANSIMIAKRKLKKSEEKDIPVPPLVKSAALWGIFLAISSNTRYQIVNGLERVVEASPIAKRLPPVALAFTVGIRFANNIYGGMQFVDWARWTGIQ